MYGIEKQDDCSRHQTAASSTPVSDSVMDCHCPRSPGIKPNDERRYFKIQTNIGDYSRTGYGLMVLIAVCGARHQTRNEQGKMQRLCDNLSLRGYMLHGRQNG